MQFSEFWTAFIWGIGVTLGGSMGMMAFVVLFTAWMRVANTKAARRASEVAEFSLQALDRRNQLTVEQIEKLDRIAAAIYATRE